MTEVRLATATPAAASAAPDGQPYPDPLDAGTAITLWVLGFTAMLLMAASLLLFALVIRTGVVDPSVQGILVVATIGGACVALMAIAYAHATARSHGLDGSEDVDEASPAMADGLVIAPVRPPQLPIPRWQRDGRPRSSRARQVHAIAAVAALAAERRAAITAAPAGRVSAGSTAPSRATPAPTTRRAVAPVQHAPVVPAHRRVEVGAHHQGAVPMGQPAAGPPRTSPAVPSRSVPTPPPDAGLPRTHSMSPRPRSAAAGRVRPRSQVAVVPRMPRVEAPLPPRTLALDVQLRAAGVHTTHGRRPFPPVRMAPPRRPHPVPPAMRAGRPSSVSRDPRSPRPARPMPPPPAPARVAR